MIRQLQVPARPISHPQLSQSKTQPMAEQLQQGLGNAISGLVAAEQPQRLDLQVLVEGPPGHGLFAEDLWLRV
jgi:hypothetical protein